MMGKSAEKLDMSSRLGVAKTPSKMAAIRGIMKERQGKRLQQKRQDTVPNLMSRASHDMPTENQADTECPDNTHGFPISITKAVTFEEEAVLFDRQNSENFEDSIFHSPSLWAMVGDGEEWSARELLHGSIMSITPGAKTLACAVVDRTDEPNVSWRDDEESNPLEESVPAQLFPPEITSRDDDDTSDLSMSSGENSKTCNHGDPKENISIHSLPPSEMTSTPLRGFLDNVHSFPPVLQSSSPFTTFKQNSTSVELHETNFYVDKIEELEQKLAAAEKRAASEEAKRVEAEHFVLSFSRRATVCATTSVQPISATKTPSNKVVGMSPMTPGCDSVSSVLSESLWERNMTLVKEVRFADQTCVELSGQKLALEKQMIVLENNMATISRENEELKNQLAKANEACGSADAKIASLQLAGHVHVRLGTHGENKATELPSGEGAPSQRDSTGPNVLKSYPSPDGHCEGVNTSQEDLLWMNDVLEKNLKESQITVESLSSELATLHAKNESLMSQLLSQRAQAKISIERVVQAMHIQGDTFSNKLVGRLKEVESRLDQLIQTVLWMENELVFESEDEDLSRSSSLESNGESSSEPATTAENESDSLIQMEEARSGTRSMTKGMAIQVPPASNTLSPFSQRTESNLSLSNPQGISALSESTSVMEQGDNDDQLCQHLLWLSSPDAVQAPMTPGLADAFKENDSNCRSKSAKKPTDEQHSRHSISPRRLVEASAREDLDTGAHTKLPSADGLFARLEFLQRQTDATEQKLAAKGIFPKATQSPRLTVLASRVATDQLSQQLSTLCQQKEEDDRKLQNLTSALQDATAIVERLSKECESLHEEGDRMLVEKKELMAINMRLQNELDELSEEVAAKEMEGVRRLLESTEVLCQKYEIDLKEAKEDKKNVEAIKSKEIDSLNKLLQRTQERTRECEAALQQALADKGAIQTTTNKEIQSWKSAHQLIRDQLIERDACLQQALLDNNKLDHDKRNAENESQTLKTKLEESRAALLEARRDNERIESIRTSLEKGLATAESRLKEREKEFLSSVENQEDAISDLQQKNGVMSLKCERLRAYVRKLTAKCDEWEGFLERHSQFVHQLENKYEKSRQQARQLAELYTTEKAKALSLQHELDLTARELQKMGI